MSTGGGMLVYLYGPPASGKLTVAEALVTATGFRLFHNHLTVDALTPVFDRHSPEFRDVLQRLRLDVFAHAAAGGVDLIFTNNNAWGGEDGRSRFEEFTSTVAATVREHGGDVLFVQLVASHETLHARLDNESRRAHDKLRDPVRLDELLIHHDPQPLHADGLIIDTEQTTPESAATAIAAVIKNRRATRSRGNR